MKSSMDMKTYSGIKTNLITTGKEDREMFLLRVKWI